LPEEWREPSTGVTRDIIVAGASAGGIDALRVLASTLPSDFPGALFVVLHVPPWRPSALPEILTRSGPLPARHAKDKEPIQRGCIYVAPPDHHLLLEEGMTRLWRGPRENRFRPAVNALFRSAAVAYRARVTGLVLSGALDDGSAGLWWVAHYGGAALVQDPNEAAVAAMPQSAIEHVDTARVTRVREMGALLTRMAKGEELEAWKQSRA
jgi:two-component system, chemotaxis family, protein-glutamate methylesterase/glutaminase